MLSKQVKEIMTKDVVTISPDADVVHAFEKLMKHRVSAMPVMEGESMVGIITASDLGHNLILDKYELGTQVESIMVKDVITVSPEDTVAEAIKIMAETIPGSDIINQLPVIEDGKLVGIISDGDIIKFIL